MTKKRSSILGALTDQINANMANAESRPSHRPMPAPTQLVHFDEKFQETVDELERLKKAGASGFDVPLDQLKNSPYQLAPLDEERVEGLVENLRHNPLNSPVVVRQLSDGSYELLAGHHRAEAFRRLGRLTIRAVVQEVQDDEAERLVFYDNLLAPSLTDYEKYLGFARRIKSKGFSQEEAALEAGVSRPVVSALMQFERLPAEAQTLIKASPKGATARLFRDLAPLAAEFEERVVEAVRKVIEGSLAVTAAPAWVRKKGAAATVQSSKVLIKRGQKTYAEVRHRAGQVVVSFSDSSEASRVAKDLIQVLQEQAQRLEN